MRFVRLAVQVAVTGALLTLTGAASARAQSGPPPVRSASLTQQGQNLVWSVRLARPFWPSRLAHAHSALCLLIEWRSGRTRADVCVSPARHRRPLRLAIDHRRIDATVTRPATDSLAASFLPSAIGMRYTRLRWQVCLEQASRCASPLPARAPTLKLHVPRLVGCVARGPDEVFHGPTNVHDIALSFDDGPWPDPPSIDFVNELARLHVPGTFFEIGNQIGTEDRNGSVERAMLAHGDMIGDHTWTHPNMLSLSPAGQRSELGMTATAIKRATGFQVCLFRPPYGDVDSELTGLARSMGMSTIMWDIDPRDWALPGTGAIESNVISNATNGGIAELHFGGGPRYETLDALPTIVRTLRSRGYRFVTLTQMLGDRLIYK